MLPGIGLLEGFACRARFRRTDGRRSDLSLRQPITRSVRVGRDKERGTGLFLEGRARRPRVAPVGWAAHPIAKRFPAVVRERCDAQGAWFMFPLRMLSVPKQAPAVEITSLSNARKKPIKSMVKLKKPPFRRGFFGRALTARWSCSSLIPCGKSIFSFPVENPFGPTRQRLWDGAPLN